MAALRPLAVVTGTARACGIGRACARAFVREGYVVIGVDKVQLEAAAEDGRWGKQYTHLQLDLSSPAEVAALPAALGSRQVSCLVNNAGITDPHLPDGAVLETWNQVIAVNLTGPFLLTETLLPLLAPGASIVHISSTRALQSEPRSEAYAAAKAGLLGLTHAQAATLAGRARVNTVLPGWIETTGGAASLRREDHNWHPAGRVGVPADVAEMVLFLADSSKSSFITGQQFVVDGGVTRKMVYPE